MRARRIRSTVSHFAAIALLAAGVTVLAPMTSVAVASTGGWAPISGTVDADWSPASVSCLPGTESCTAVGNFSYGPQSGQALVLNNASGAWQPEPNSAPPPGLFYAIALSDVSCVTGSFCAAVGHAQPASDPQAVEPVVATFDGDGWSFTELDVSTSQAGYGLVSVSCPSVTNCTAVGSVGSGSNFSKSLVVNFDGSNWTPILLSNPGQYSSEAIAGLSSVSCPDVSTCVAVGYYSTDPAETLQGFSQVSTNGVWNYSPTPRLVGSNALFDVDCTSSQSCVAVGDQSGQFQTLIEDYISGAWSVEGVPTSGQLRSVSCPVTMTCAAVGYNRGNPLVMTTPGSNDWSVQSSPPPNFSGGPETVANFGGVSCSSTTACVAAGWGAYYPPGEEGGYSAGFLDAGSILDIPSVTAVSPSSGPPAGGTVVTIDGDGFSTAPGATSFDFGPGNQATSVACSSTRTCTATAPPGAGIVDVTVTVDGQISPTNEPADQFSYVTRAPQSISWTTAPPDTSTFGQHFAVAASASSGLPVTITTSGPCSYSGGNVTSTAAGVCTVMADQAGDGTWLPASELSAPVSLVTVSVTSSADPASIGQAVTFTATAASPKGSVRFYDGTKLLSTKTINAGVATLVTSKLTVATHTITASFTASRSAPVVSPQLLEHVDPAATNVFVTSNRNPSVSGKTISFKVSVVRIAPALGKVSVGTLALYNDGLLLGQVPLKNGVGHFVTNALSIGEHQITVEYGGSLTDQASSTPTPLVETVH